MAKRIESLKILENKRLNNEYFTLEISGIEKFPEMKPGQFAQIKVEGSPDTFLRRPISIHDVNTEKNTIKFLIQIAGKGTEKLSKLKQNDFLNVIY
ncbi:MAG: dihydroorotate dehydrogenase electron transfer subunit, partial [Bacteroidia bacterium]|nr:dihydroorotate dehydrogenase electron transfer subunit [Bacteroidia bacterium]